MYEYRTKVLRVVDGDTLHLEVDMGCDVRLNMTVRLLGINAPENSTEAGRKSTAWLKTRLPEGSTCTLVTVKDRKEKYGRYLASLYTHDQIDSVNAQMVSLGLAVPYMLH